MGRRVRAKKLTEEDMGQPAAFLSSGGRGSSSDEEANQDLSLEIVERARRRRHEEGSNTTKRPLEAPARRTPSLTDLSSLDEVDAVLELKNGGVGETEPAKGNVVVATAVKGSRKKRKKKKHDKMVKRESDAEELSVRGESESAETVTVKNDEEVIETADSVVTEVNDDISDNIVFRKLLRGPRYFDPGSSQLESCYNCGEEGHIAADCTSERRKRPCFVCGMFGHNAHKCTQGQDCAICKRRGHRTKDCPDKHQNISGETKICLRCGDFGHDMSSCRNDYPSDDLKKIQCYVCKCFGHFCCLNYIDKFPREVSCYNCGASGHSGVGCAKPRGQSTAAVLPTLCYVCGEEGHFARGCTRKSKINRQPREPSTPGGPSKKNKDNMGSKSLPHNIGKGYKKSLQSNGTRNETAEKPKIKDGWIVDDASELPRRIRDVKSLKSPRTPKAPVKMSYRFAGS